jgi:hypothetical protein
MTAYDRWKTAYPPHWDDEEDETPEPPEHDAGDDE